MWWVWNRIFFNCGSCYWGAANASLVKYETDPSEAHWCQTGVLDMSVCLFLDFVHWNNGTNLRFTVNHKGSCNTPVHCWGSVTVCLSEFWPYAVAAVFVLALRLSLIVCVASPRIDSFVVWLVIGFAWSVCHRFLVFTFCPHCLREMPLLLTVFSVISANYFLAPSGYKLLLTFNLSNLSSWEAIAYCLLSMVCQWSPNDTLNRLCSFFFLWCQP